MEFDLTGFARRQNELAAGSLVSRHPEDVGDLCLTPTIGDQMRLDRFLESMKGATEEELREALALLAHQFFVAAPVQVRYLAREAARNLMGAMSSS